MRSVRLLILAVMATFFSSSFPIGKWKTAEPEGKLRAATNKRVPFSVPAIKRIPNQPDSTSSFIRKAPTESPDASEQIRWRPESSLPIEFSLLHTERKRDANGDEIEALVNTEPNVLLRDEIATLVIAVPVVENVDWNLTLDLETEEMKTSTLGSRGAVQMYDFGTVATNGSVTSLSKNPDGTTKAGPYDIQLLASQNGIGTFRIVVNKEGKFQLRLKSRDHRIEAVSREFTVKKRIRKYAVPFCGFLHHDPNRYDDQFEEAVEHWGNFYGQAIDDVDRVKAIAVAESNVGARVSNPALRPHDILTVGTPEDGVLQRIRGLHADSQWDLDLSHPKKPAGDARYRKLCYSQAGIGSTRDAIKWGVLWLYVKAFGRPVNIEPDPDWSYESRNKAPFTVIDGNERPESRFKEWSSWEYATESYNGGGVGNYMERVNTALQNGLHWNAGHNNKLWPILTDESGRSEAPNFDHITVIAPHSGDRSAS